MGALPDAQCFERASRLEPGVGERVELIAVESADLVGGRQQIRADPEREHFNFFNWHLRGYDRKECDARRQNDIPCNLGEIPDYYRRYIEPPEIMVIKTCSVDADGYFNLSTANLWHRAVASRAKIVIVETDPALPYVHGIENGLHMSEVDYVIEAGGQAVPELANLAPTDADRAVARLIAAEIDDSACLQISIGAMPNAVCSLLVESGVQPRRAHRDAHRRHHRSLPGRRGDRVGEEHAPGQDRVQLWSRLEEVV